MTRLLVASLLVMGLAAPATAVDVTLTSGTLSLLIAGTPAAPGLPPVTAAATPTTITVSSGAGSFTEPLGVFGPVPSILLPRSLFTGVPQISGLSLLGFGNGTKTFNGANGTAVGGLVGTTLVNVLQLLNLSIPLSVVGAPGASVQAGAGAIVITVKGQGWTTGTAMVTAITTTTPGTAVINTVSSNGSDARTVNHGGSMTLISGFQAITNVAGTLPGFAVQELTFVPEPGALLLLGGGALAFVIYGRMRQRK